MPSRPPGRPKARNPRDVKVTVRLTEREADLLQRLAKQDSLSAALRHALERYINVMGGPSNLPDTDHALIGRELRKAKRMASPEGDALAQLFALEEPAAAAPTVISPQITKIETETKTIPVEVEDVATGKKSVVPVPVSQPKRS
jgi:hypothetical protein